MFEIDYNPIAKRYEERFNGLPQEKKDLINKPLKRNENFIKLKRNKTPIQVGDVFVCSMVEGLYFYGKVLYTNAENEYAKDGKNVGILLHPHVVFLFRQRTKEKSLRDFKADYDNLLIKPAFVTTNYWSTLGYFENVGNIPLTKEERALDYGFFHSKPIGQGGTFVKPNGEPIDHIPKIFGIYGIKTYAGMYSCVRDETIIDPTLLKMD